MCLQRMWQFDESELQHWTPVEGAPVKKIASSKFCDQQLLNTFNELIDHHQVSVGTDTPFHGILQHTVNICSVDNILSFSFVIRKNIYFISLFADQTCEV